MVPGLPPPFSLSEVSLPHYQPHTLIQYVPFMPKLRTVMPRVQIEWEGSCALLINKQKAKKRQKSNNFSIYNAPCTLQMSSLSLQQAVLQHYVFLKKS